MNQQTKIQNSELADIIIHALEEEPFFSAETIKPKIVAILNAFHLKELINSRERWRKHNEINERTIIFLKRELAKIYPDSMIDEIYQEMENIKTKTLNNKNK